MEGTMSAGRKRLPSKIKIIRGTFRKDRALEHEAEPEPVREPPRPPAHLLSAGKKLWKALARELADKGILTVVDLPALEVLCYNYGLYRDLHEAIFRPKSPPDPITGRVTKGRRTLAQYMEGRNSQTMPEYVQMTKAFATVKAYQIEFGLTPSARSKIEIREPESENTDPLEQMFNEA
jgi:P27 family predicted phage terminase small subunit